MFIRDEFWNLFPVAQSADFALGCIGHVWPFVVVPVVLLVWVVIDAIRGTQ